MLNAFEQVADQQLTAATKARHRATDRRLERLVVKSEADAPMVASPADKKMFEQSQQMRRYRLHLRQRQDELANGPHGREVVALIQLLDTLTASSANALVSHVMKAEWLRSADLNTRLDVLSIVGTAIARFRVRNGLPPFDDALPFSGEPPTAFEQIRKLLTGVGHD